MHPVEMYTFSRCRISTHVAVVNPTGTIWVAARRLGGTRLSAGAKPRARGRRGGRLSGSVSGPSRTSLANLLDLGVREALDVLENPRRGVRHARHRVIPAIYQLLDVGGSDAKLLQRAQVASAGAWGRAKAQPSAHLKLLHGIRAERPRILAGPDINLITCCLSVRHGASRGRARGNDFFVVSCDENAKPSAKIWWTPCPEFPNLPAAPAAARLTYALCTHCSTRRSPRLRVSGCHFFSLQQHLLTGSLAYELK